MAEDKLADAILNIHHNWQKARLFAGLERQKKMAEKVLQCPKCHEKDIQVIETIEAVSEHRVINGVWHHEHDNNEYGNGIRTECFCVTCGHRWYSPRGINFENYFLSETN